MSIPPIKVTRRLWRNNLTGQITDLIVIRERGVFVKIPFDQARQIVDQVHDLCDRRDQEQTRRTHS